MVIRLLTSKLGPMAAALAASLSLGTQSATAQTCAERADIALYMAVDMSGSMAGAGQTGAADFGVALIDGLSATGFLDRGGAFGFSDVITGEVVMTTNIGVLRAALDGVRSLGTGGGTLLYDAIVTGANVIYGQSSSFERLLVVLSDGADTGSANTAASAAAALSPGVNTELIYIGSGSNPMNGIASGKPHVQARTSTASALTSLVSEIVARTCRNFQPDAAFTRSPSASLVLGSPGFSMSFNGGPSSDTETPDSGLTFAWTLTGPSRTINLSGIMPSANFTDSDIGSWSVQLRVTDANGHSDTSTATFAIEGVPPSITASGPGTIDALDTITLSVSPLSDTDGGNLTFDWDVLEAPGDAVLQPPGPGAWTNATESFVTTETDITEVEGMAVGTWRFGVTATDDEGDTDDDAVTVIVRNLPPRINLDVPATEIDIFEAIQASTTITMDDDGGPLILDWDLVQVPDSAGLPVQDSVQTGASFGLSTSEIDAGTWILRLRAEDNEGAEIEEDNIKILVDGPVSAEVTGPEETSMLSAFTLSGEESVDPDTPCPNLGGGCHSTDGRAPDISGGIDHWQWSIADLPSEHVGDFSTGPVDEVLGIDGSGPTLNVPIAALRVGTWRFELHVRDAEGNEDSAFHSIEVIAPEGAPFAITSGPQLHVLGPGGVLDGAVFVNGENSFDLDNLLIGDSFGPGMGITSYAWMPLISPTACAAAVPFGTPAGVLFGPGPVAIPPACEGVFQYQLTVTDDDAAPKTDTETQSIFITGCPDVVCIEDPTFEMPRDFAFSDETDVEILYKVDQTLYDLSGCLFGCAAELRIFHEDDLLTPVFTATEYNPQPTLFGYSPVFKWNGFVRNPVTDAIERPRQGLYTTQIELVDLVLNPVAEDTESQNISIAVADVELTPATEDLLSLNGAEDGTDALEVDYQVTGGAMVTEAKLHVWETASSTLVDTVAQPSGPTGSFTYTGQPTPTTYIDPDTYEVSVEIIGPAGVLDESPRQPVTAYRLDLEVDGVSEADEETTGAEVSDSVVPIRVVLEPDGMTGDILVVEDGGTTSLGPSVWAGGVTVAAADAFPAFDSDVIVTEDPGSDISFVARYTPPGAPATKQAEDRVTVVPLLADATAGCSDDGREDAEGLFVQRRTQTGPVVFAEEKFWMRKLDVTASLQADEVRIDQTAGTAGAVQVLVRPNPGADPVAVSLPHSFAPALFDADGRLETDVYVQGVTADPELRLTVEILRSGAAIAGDEIRLRVDDLGPLAGSALADFPFWTGRTAVTPGEAVSVALDPAYHDDRRGLTGHVHIVARKTPAEWAAANSLSDVTGGPDALAVPAMGDITASQTAAWASAAAPGAGVAKEDYDIVIDFGDCTPGAATDGTLDPEDIIVPADVAGLTVFPDLTTPGPLGATVVDYGTDFERAPLGAVCTPTTEAPAGASCNPALANCPFGTVCVDTDADGTARCTPVDPAGTPACPANTLCVNTNNDEIAHCQGPAPTRVEIPVGYDGIGGPTLEHGQEFRLRGRIVHPSPMNGPHPLVVIAHGRHSPKITAPEPIIGDRPRWSEEADTTTLGQNYEGYTYLQQHLASHGYISVSVDLDEAIGNGSGGRDLGYPDLATAGINLRAWILLKSVEEVLSNPAIAGQVDSSRLHFLGHSRGGEAVLRARNILANVAAQGPASAGLVGPDAAVAGFTLADLRSVMSLAPTSFETNSTPIGTTPFFLVYGTTDGDVNGFSSPVVQPLRHLDETRGSGPSTGLWLTGGNHNFFSDAWPADDGGPFSGPRVSRPDQREIAKGYALAWLRFIEGEAAYRTLFETAPSRLMPITLGGSPGLHVQSRLGPVDVLDDYQSNSATTTASSGASVAVTVSNANEMVLLDGDNSDETNTPNRFKQLSTGMLFDWSGAATSIVFTPSGGSVDLSDKRSLVLRAGQEPRHPRTAGLAGTADFTITLTDGGGHSATINAGFDAGVMPVQNATVPMSPTDWTLAFMNDVRIALDRFKVNQPDLDMRQITTITFEFGAPASAQGRLAIDDVEFQE